MISGFYFITGRKLSKKGNLEDVKNAVRAGVTVVQYREKEKSAQEMIEEAKKLKEICKGKALFLINDRADIALAVDADGIHLGQDDMQYGDARRLLGNKVIGLTAHNIEEAKQAEELGADYIGLSPIFATTTKADAGAPAGPDLIRKVKKGISIPIVAIGGITKENTPELIRAGADSVAAISAVVTKEDVQKEVREFIGIINKNK